MRYSGDKLQFETPWAHEARSPGGPPVQSTDLGNAHRLVIGSRDDLRYCHQWKQWLVWDGRRWAKDDTGEVWRRAKAAVRAMLLDAAAELDDDRRKEILRWQRTSEAERALRAMITLARSEPGIPVRQSDLDCDPMLFNCLNGTLDLETSRFRDHTREDMLTKLALVIYDQKATCPIWNHFLEQVMAGDVELMRYLQRVAGYSLTGDIREHALFLLYGTGSNGKSTFLEVLRSVLGDYAMQADFDSFLAQKGGRGVRNDLARLTGARFVTAIESEVNARLAENIIKHITGGDKVTARFLYSEHFEFWPQFKLFLATNHKPTVRGTDHAIWRRIHLVPFSVTIPNEAQDRDLPSKLRQEAAGILNWALDGLRAWQKHGLKPPAAVLAATEEYRSEQDVLQHFLNECCTADPTAESKASELYARYKRWCDAGGERPLSKRALGLALGERRFIKRARHDGIYWTGVRFSSESCEP